MAATLQSLIDNEAGAEGLCRKPHCRGGAALDIAALAARYGGAVTLDQLEPRLVCPSCGEKTVAIVCYARRHGRID